MARSPCPWPGKRLSQRGQGRHHRHFFMSRFELALLWVSACTEKVQTCFEKTEESNRTWQNSTVESLLPNLDRVLRNPKFDICKIVYFKDFGLQRFCFKWGDEACFLSPNASKAADNPILPISDSSNGYLIQSNGAAKREFVNYIVCSLFLPRLNGTTPLQKGHVE